ncbi:transglutaminase-like cysteine peptidase [Rhizobium sp. SSA_523]|uniref:transglutaminase-like cysteine peptidase n=1 Tax=Rhizobium sp. SSA_523 TaxID=2952477 RepID=UPI0020910C5B|nr:transglutaminase-like cysteine peptidase [Rhizobium sp. SSA_523]MCO5732761.1 transglutaminase-like cysteine peptidase [Rhizobium sp. SSA_523]WKC23621.1 transglutaminase-like cysteine peptidase [Rhizobium sp. SSA_523]
MMNAFKARHFAVMITAVLAPTASALPAPLTTAHMATGQITSQPIGHYEFCQTRKDECNQRFASSAAPKVTEFGWDAIRSVNASVNHRITAKTDMEVYGREEVWAYPKTAGDCEDYALEKRKELAAKGFSLTDLLMTVVRKPDGEGHAVLTVRTADGDYILDNLTDDVKLWTDTSYTFLKRQASFNTGRWVTIEDGREVVVGALR